MSVLPPVLGLCSIELPGINPDRQSPRSVVVGKRAIDRSSHLPVTIDFQTGKLRDIKMMIKMGKERESVEIGKLGKRRERGNGVGKKILN